MAHIQTAKVMYLDDEDILEALEFWLAEKYSVQVTETTKQFLQYEITNFKYRQLSVEDLYDNYESQDEQERLVDRIYNNFKLLRDYAAKNRVCIGVMLNDFDNYDVKHKVFNKLSADGMSYDEAKEIKYIKFDVMGLTYTSTELPSVASAKLARQISFNSILQTYFKI